MVEHEICVHFEHDKNIMRQVAVSVTKNTVSVSDYDTTCNRYRANHTF